MIKLEKCIVCSKKNITEKMICKDFTVSGELFKIVSCETCGFTFTNPRPKDEDLQKYYISNSYISHTNNKKGLFNTLYQAIRLITINRKVKLLKSMKKNGKVLDIGCGTGEFLNKCKRNGYETIGFEPSDMARKQAVKNFDIEVMKSNSFEKLESNSVSIITMWHVLEHIPDIENVLVECSRLIKDNGIIYIAVPNYLSWEAKYYKNYWAAWDTPIHLWHFIEKTIKLLFKKYNLELIKTKPMIFDSFYVSLLSEEYKTGSKNYIKSFIIGLLSNIIAIFSKKGHSSNIYMFKKTKTLK